MQNMKILFTLPAFLSSSVLMKYVVKISIYDTKAIEKIVKKKNHCRLFCKGLYELSEPLKLNIPPINGTIMNNSI